ncbi:MAG: DUF1634 domain-containing protein [Paraburkholderia sp.]|uniref:DUF1634 domain-containing protein n=1 Tax=Paraburkholderia sp. TaxID=1926495 RepID=UPI003C5F61F0
MSRAIPTEAALAARVVLERRLATLLKYGTWLASLIIAAGLLLTQGASYLGMHQAAHAQGMQIVTVGIALFIFLPVLRLMLMLGVFLHQRDYRFTAVTTLVLLIVFAGCVIGAHMSGGAAG